MFCRICGNSMPDGTSFCTACGAQQGAPAPQPAPQPVAEPTGGMNFDFSTNTATPGTRTFGPVSEG